MSFFSWKKGNKRIRASHRWLDAFTSLNASGIIIIRVLGVVSTMLQKLQYVSLRCNVSFSFYFLFSLFSYEREIQHVLSCCERLTVHVLKVVHWESWFPARLIADWLKLLSFFRFFSLYWNFNLRSRYAVIGNYCGVIFVFFRRFREFL